MTMERSFNLADYYLFDRLSEGLGDSIALRFGPRRWTYTDVAQRSLSVAQLLVGSGLKSGQRVYLILPDRPCFAWCFFGALKAGAVVAMGNPISSPESLADVIDYVTPHVVITTREVADKLKTHRSNYADTLFITVPDVGTMDDPEAITNHPECLNKKLKATIEAQALPITYEDSPAIWLFTSGSTGRPKAAMHCHSDFRFNTEQYAKKTLGYQANEICVSVPRLFFGYATGTNLMFPFSVGASVGLFVEKPTAERIAWAVDYYQATMLTSVPTLMARLLDMPEQSTSALSQLRFCLSAGEALPPVLLERWLTRFDVPVYDGIGSAEMFHIYLTNHPGDIKPGSLGKPVNGYVCKILGADAEGPGAPEVSENETGVLWVKGNSVAQGYWLDRAKSWQTFYGHWCRTGDLFRRDGDGYYWFGGRADHLMKVSGQWVSPVEVEHCLVAHPAVLEAAIVPMEIDGLTRTRAWIALVPEVNDIDEGALKSWVAQKLAKYKTPHEVRFMAELPKNDRGKIDKGALK